MSGRVVSIAADAVLLEIGARSEAVADAREFRDAEGNLTVNVGDTLELFVAEVAEPLVLAKTAKKRRGRPSVEALRAARASGLPVRGKVTGTNKGGWTVDVDGVRAFCPLSQVDLQRHAPGPSAGEDVTSSVGRVLEFLVTEVDPARARVVLSRRSLLLRQQAEQAREKLAKIAPGQDLEGTITRLETFGAFVDLGGLEGLVHISELSHARVAHARDVVAVGDQVRVHVLRVDSTDERRPRVSLSLRATTPDPWAAAMGQFTAGARVPGVVVRLADFGAFVNLAPGVDGLVHVSQVSDRRVQHVREVLSPGQAVEVVVLSVDPERKRISLSIRDALESPIAASQVTLDTGPEAPREPRNEGHREPRSEGAPESRGEGHREKRREGRRPERRDAGPRRAGAGEERGGARPKSRGGPDARRGRGEDARSREETQRSFSSSHPEEPAALTPMQLAFKKAREEQARREQRG